jgi:hypothetical protein
MTRSFMDFIDQHVFSLFTCRFNLQTLHKTDITRLHPTFFSIAECSIKRDAASSFTSFPDNFLFAIFAKLSRNDLDANP